MSVRLTPADGSLEILAISRHEWRVRDASKPPSDATSLLGFIEQTGGIFDVVSMDQPRLRRLFPTFDDAVNTLTGISGARSGRAAA